MADRVLKVIDHQVRVSVAGGPLVAALAGAAAAAAAAPYADRAEAAEQSIADILANAGEVQGGGSVTFQAAGSGSSVRSVQDKLRERVTPFDFGAVGDGVTDDTAAFLAAIEALRSGGTLYLGDGYSFLLSQSLVFEKPINIRGGSQEQTKLIFASDGTYLSIGSGQSVAMLFVHFLTTITGFSGDARRSVVSGLTVFCQAGAPAGLRGLCTTTPIYAYEVRVEGFPSDGFNILSAPTSSIDGIANGCVFTNCIAIYNGGSGFYLAGINANACLLNRCHAFENGAWGFYDDSGLGNTYIACEADANGDGGYWAEKTKAIRSVYFGCYSETPTYYDLNARCLRIGDPSGNGFERSAGGVVFAALPNGDAFSTQAYSVASSINIANAKGEAPNAGSYWRSGDEGFEFKASAASKRVSLSGVLSVNYTDFVVDGSAAIRFPNSAFAGNLAVDRPHLPQGFTTGGSAQSGILGAGSAAPTTGTYAAGAIWLNDAPAPSGKVGWVCTTGGSPGTWKAFGAIDA